MYRLPRAVLALAVATTLAPVRAEAAEPDWAKARDEAVALLQQLIRIDTSNPPGNETRAAEHLKAVLEREGVPAVIHEGAPGRGSLVARLRGSGGKRPVLIMGHTDVVGVERDKWSVDPFAGVVKDGEVWGRGAADDKDTVAAGLTALLLLHREKVPLDRDVIFVAEAGEEGTPGVGIEFLIEKHWDEIEAEYALAEGGMTPTRDGKVLYLGVATTEKLPRRVRLVARGTSGHGSQPRADNAIVHLARAVARLGAWLPPARLNETTRVFFQKMAAISPPEEAFLATHIEDPLVGALVQEQLRHTNIAWSSMLRTSISPTIFNGGFRSNVIPGEAEATLDVRALPDEDMERFAEQLRRIIDDPAVEVIPTLTGRPATAPAPLDSEMFRALERAQARIFPGVATIPMMLTGATDMAQLRARGVQAYGIGGPAPEGSRAHGNDERVPVEGIGKLVELIYRAVTDVAASRGAAPER
jgi:acetylornithine deacetylase/succinyl-diaminopimelate desuccinylase-like protein